jgi:hypothetical protein
MAKYEAKRKGSKAVWKNPRGFSGGAPGDRRIDARNLLGLVRSTHEDIAA